MRKKILIVDDEREYQTLMRGMLTRAGYETEECRFGGSVLSRLMQKDIDLVIMDYMMPEVNGDQIILSMKSMESLKALPVIVVTGHHELSVDFFKDMGAEEVMYKPVDFDELASKIKKYL